MRTKKNRSRICDLCGKEIKNAGWRGHRLWVHGIEEIAAKLALSSPVETENQIVATLQSTELKPETKGVEMTECVDCKLKDRDIKDLRDNLAKAEDAAKKAEQARELLSKELTETKQQTNKPADIPDLQAVIAHCEGGHCSPHAQQWQAVKSEIIKAAYEDIPPEIVEQRAEALGLIPKKIIISGLSARRLK